MALETLKTFEEQVSLWFYGELQRMQMVEAGLLL